MLPGGSDSLEYVQVVTTFPSQDRALQVAETIVEQRLAACAHVGGPITSVHRWEGKIHETIEWTVTFKTRRDKCDSLEHALKELHPYDTPEILGTCVDEAYVRYLRWLDEGLDGESGIWSRRTRS